MSVLKTGHSAPSAQPPRSVKRSALAHIPGDEGLPIVGRTLHILADPKGEVERMAAKYGRVHRTRILGETSVTMLGPEANDLVLFDKEKIFSSTWGWDMVLGRLFPRGLMLLDFDEHIRHRRVMLVAFRSGPMESYFDALNRGIESRVAEWTARPGSMLIYPAMKQLTLDLAATSFLGSDIGPDVEEVTRSFVDMVAAAVSPVRKPLPFTQMRRGVQGRERIIAYFARQIPMRRKGQGQDLFSQLCRAKDDEGASLSNEDIVDHMSFLMMAAHDTLTSSLTSFVAMLAMNPEWQQKLRDEVAALKLSPGQPLSMEALKGLPLAEMAFKESMRLKPPVPSIPRRAAREFSFGGYTIPAGTLVGVNPLYTHHMSKIWPDPDRFDPLRFTDEAQRERHRFAWVPFGGGLHMCLGVHFAYMQAKCFSYHFVKNLNVSLEPGYKPQWQMWPIPKPKDGLRVTLARA